MPTHVEKKFHDIFKNTEFYGENSDKCIDEAEKALKLIFPKEYRVFLRKYGSSTIHGFEIYGLTGKLHNENYFWRNIVSSTMELRRLSKKWESLSYLLPFSDDGMGVTFYFDTRKSPETCILGIGPGYNKKITNSFFEFLIILNEYKFTY